MKKNEIKVEELIDVLTEYGLTELEYENNGKLKIKIKKDQIVSNNLVLERKDKNKSKSIESTKKIEIKSELIGRYFYDEDIIKIGNKIEQGENIGYIEVIGVKNSIMAQSSGTIVDILVKKGETVDYGKVLLILENN